MRFLPLRQSPLALPDNPGGWGLANLGDTESVVSLNSSELPGATRPLEGARDDPRCAAFSLEHRENLVAILVGHDAVPVHRGGDPSTRSFTNGQFTSVLSRKPSATSLKNARCDRPRTNT